jgi:hypothetical protein
MMVACFQTVTGFRQARTRSTAFILMADPVAVRKPIRPEETVPKKGF